MPLYRVRKSFNPGTVTPSGAAVPNIDSLRDDGTYNLTDESGGGTFPDGVVFPVSVVVSAGGDTQTLTDATPTVFVRNFGLTWWGDWA
jgi:hypothetical protein